MLRRLLALATATIVALGLIPAIAAFAVSASAVLTAGVEVFPGSNTFTVRVTNTDTLLQGGQVHAVRLLLPSDFSAPVCVASGTFTCTAQDRPGPDLIDLTGSVLTTGQSLDIRFSAQVNAPFDGDRSNKIAVSIADSPTGTLTKIADLNNKVRALDVVLGSLRPTSPVGALDGAATAGQVITYAFDVRNFAQQAQTVTAQLNTPSGNGSQVLSVPAGQARTATFSVTLRDIGTSSSIIDTFGAAATSPTANGGVRTAMFAIEHAPSLVPQANTFSNPVIRTNQPLTYNFAVNANKGFPPGVTGLTGSMSFGGRTVALVSPNTLLRNPQTNVRLDFAPMANPAMPPGTYDVRFDFSGTDDNGHPWVFTQTLTGLITVDNIAPILTFNPLGNGGRPQAKNGDSISVSGTVDDTPANAPLDYVRLVSTEGVIIPVTNVVRNGQNWSGSVALAGLPDYTAIRGEAQATDRAGNIGFITSAPLDIDNVLPVVTDPARVISVAYRTTPVVEITLADRYIVSGGCNPAHWSVDGHQVVEVRYSDGSPCQNGSAGPVRDNIRHLITLQTINPDAQGSGSYLAAPALVVASLRDPVRDGALNGALDTPFDLANGVIPAIPDLGVMTRNVGAETNPLRPDGRYHTRFGGNDARITVRNSKAGQAVQVLDANGNVLTTTNTNGANAVIEIPIGTQQGAYGRKLRLINQSGVDGPTIDLAIVLDRVLPTITGAARNTDGRVVTTTTSETLVGSLNPNHWFAAEVDPTPGNNFHYYSIESISVSSTTLTMGTELGNNGPFAGVVYEFLGGATGRPEDWAGNQLADDTTP